MGIKVRANLRWTVPGKSGAIATGWKVNTYEPGTSTPKDTYTDYTGNSSNTNPVILDARGEAVIYWKNKYKVVVTDEDDVEIWSGDNYGEGEDFVLTGNYNKIKNGSFETLTAGEPDNWTVTDYTNGSHEIDATDQFHGLNSLKFTSTGSGGGYATSDFFEILGSKINTISWSLKSSVVDVRNVVDVLWYTSAQTLISTSNLYDDSATNPTSWTTKIAEGTAPSTARYARVRIYGCHSSDATSGSTWYDDILMVDDLAFKNGQNTWLATQTWSKGADLGDSDVDGSNILTLGTDGNYFDYTGTDQIDGIATVGIGTVIKIHFDTVCILTHHATDFVLPSGLNISTIAENEIELIEYAAGDWRCTSYLNKPLTTRGDILIRNATTNVRLAVGSASQVLVSDGTDVAWGAADQTSIAASAVGQGELKTASGSSLHNNNWWALPGGAYGFMPQTGSSTAGSRSSNLDTEDFTGDTNYLNIWLGETGTAWGGAVKLQGEGAGNDGGHAVQRYMSASKPYDYGHGECGLFIYLMIDKSGNFHGVALQDDPPWAYHGPNKICPHFFDKKGIGYRYKTDLPFEINDTRLSKDQLQTFVKTIINLDINKCDYYEITQNIKNADMDLIPSPVPRFKDPTHRAILLDPMSEICHKLYQMNKIIESPVAIGDLFKEGYIKFGNNALDCRSPGDVITVKPQWKLTK